MARGSEDKIETFPTVGRPRNPQLDEAILSAARKMLLERGYENLSIERVAKQAGVAKTSVYRRWGSKAHLALAVIEEMRAPLPQPDTGSLWTDLEAIMPTLKATIASDEIRQVFGTFFSILAEDEEVIEQYWNMFVRQRRDTFALILQRAQQRGEIRDDLDLDLVMDMISGSFLVQMLRPRGHEPGERVERIFALLRPLLTR